MNTEAIKLHAKNTGDRKLLKLLGELVEEDKPVKAEEWKIVLNKLSNIWYAIVSYTDLAPHEIDTGKRLVRRMKREDVEIELMDAAVGMDCEKSPIDNYLDRLEEIGLIEKGNNNE